jgi:hypothetical protein
MLLHDDRVIASGTDVRRAYLQNLLGSMEGTGKFYLIDGHAKTLPSVE